MSILVGRTRHAEILIEDEGKVQLKRLEENEDSSEINQTLTLIKAKFDRYADLVASQLKGLSRQEAARRLGNSLLEALVVLDRDGPLEAEAKAEDYLNEAAAFISEQLARRARLVYVKAALLSGLVLATLLLIGKECLGLVFEDDTTSLPFIFGCLGGCLGTCVSILHRNNKLEIDSYSSKLVIQTDGVMRVLLGCLFGAVAAILIKSQMLLNLEYPEVKNAWNDYKVIILTIGMVAGFSERLIPELLGKIEQGLRTQGEEGE